MNRKQLSLIMLALVILLTGASAQTDGNGQVQLESELPLRTFAWGCGEPFIHEDQVCFLGNSITKGGLYGSYIELFYATRYPGRSPRFFNAGVGGDRASKIWAARSFRLQTDVLDRHPTAVVLMLGMNDVERSLYGDAAGSEELESKRRAALDLYAASMTNILNTLQAEGCKITLVTPSLYDQTAVLERPAPLIGVDDALGHCADLMRQWQRTYHTGLVDAHGAMNRINCVRQRYEPSYSIIGAGQNWNDRVHPGPVGSFVVAYTFLRAQGVDGLVSYIDLDAAVCQPGNQTRKARLGPITCSAGSLEFEVLEGSLPMVVPPQVEPALKLVAFTDELNRQILRVTNLPSDQYLVSVDAKEIGSFSAEELLQGINLASQPNMPQFQQALAVSAINEALRAARELSREVTTLRYGMANSGEDWRDPGAYARKVTVMLNKALETGSVPAWIEAQSREVTEPGALDREIAEMEKRLSEACRPVPHRYLITPDHSRKAPSANMERLVK